MSEPRDTPGAPNYRPLHGTSVGGAQHGLPVKFYRYRGGQPLTADPPRREAA